MAFELTARVFQDPTLPPGARLVLAVLAVHANTQTKLCWPGIRRIMARTGMGERTVLRAIKLLRTGGYIETAKGRSKARTTLYTLHPEKWPQPIAKTSHFEQVKPAESNGSDTPTEQQNMEGKGGEGISKAKSKAKTCDKSQKKVLQAVSKPMGKSDKGVHAQENDKKSDKSNIENNAVKTTAATKLAPLPPPPKRASKLGTLWLDHSRKQGFDSCLTDKEGKMLRDAAQKIEYSNMAQVIPLVIAEWKAFTDYCYYQGVSFTRPKTPQVGFFLKFVANAFAFAKKRARKAELKAEKESAEKTRLQLLAQHDDLRDSIAANANALLAMEEKKQIMGIDSRYITAWEKVFGPVSYGYRHPAFEPNIFYDEYCSDPTLPLPDPSIQWVQNMRDYFAKLQMEHRGGPTQLDRDCRIVSG